MSESRLNNRITLVLASQAFNDCSAAFGANFPIAITSMKTLVEILLTQGKYENAETILQHLINHWTYSKTPMPWPSRNWDPTIVLS
jgi:hypothetical protein